ncbi:hypothetical protein [Ectobacillus panaciterrae]|uniref:hypothetical protein n=1 Tax=Ectobacillus panaciterrae TaxID=363872 RepID=UPI0003F56054|nr:hypothetical protein [Ectobacillus panaciterrae]
MSICIKKFIVVNNFGTISFADSISEMPMKASKSNNGATGPVVADFVNGRRVFQTQDTGANEANTGQTIEEATAEDISGTNL